MIFKTLLLLLTCAFVKVNSAKILGVFPMPSISHQVVFRTITQELIKNGHEVTVITPDPVYPNGKSPSNLTEIDVHDISYKIWQKFLQAGYESEQKQVSKFTEMQLMLTTLSKLVQVQLQTPQVQTLINDKNKNFDLILIEEIFRPALAYSHIYDAPVIIISSLGAVFNSHEIMGSMMHPFLYPLPLLSKIYNLSLWDKLYHLYVHYTLQYSNYIHEFDENTCIKQILGPDVPPLSKLYNNVHMFFMNIYPIWADNQPVPPGVVYMGGIHQMPEKELPKDLRAYLDSSKNGVIYVSFGTNILSGMIPPNKVQMMTNALSKLPYDVLWKWDKHDLPGNSSNIKISQWLPQSDLLRHPKVKLFVTQAGLQSTDEAITAGIPLVSIPMFGDQWYNADKYVKHGIGKKLEIESLTEDDFTTAVETVINDKSYRMNVEKLRTFMRDQPEPPLKRAVWWIEYTLRHKGAKQLRAISANISLAEYIELDLILLVLSTVIIVLSFSILTLVFVFRFIYNLLSKKKVKSN